MNTPTAKYTVINADGRVIVSTQPNTTFTVTELRRIEAEHREKQLIFSDNIVIDVSENTQQNIFQSETQHVFLGGLTLNSTRTQQERENLDHKHATNGNPTERVLAGLNASLRNVKVAGDVLLQGDFDHITLQVAYAGNIKAAKKSRAESVDFSNVIVSGQVDLSGMQVEKKLYLGHRDAPMAVGNEVSLPACSCDTSSLAPCDIKKKSSGSFLSNLFSRSNSVCELEQKTIVDLRNQLKTTEAEMADISREVKDILIQARVSLGGNGAEHELGSIQTDPSRDAA